MCTSKAEIIANLKGQDGKGCMFSTALAQFRDDFTAHGVFVEHYFTLLSLSPPKVAVSVDSSLALHLR